MSAAFNKSAPRPVVFSALLLSLLAPVTAEGQSSQSVPAFAGGALMVGAQGFARPPVNTAVTGAYAYVPVGALLIGGQGAIGFGDGTRSRAAHGLVTVAYPRTRTGNVQIYPYVGIGAATLRARPGRDDVRLAVGAGFGGDALSGTGRTSVMVGARMGFVARSSGDDESVAFAAISVGFGRRRDPRDPPRSVAARQLER
jgi:hypothetical protein